MGRFALCIPDGSDGTRALPPCSDRRWQVAGTAGQPYLVFRSLAFLLGMGQPPGGRRRSPTPGRRPTAVEVRTWVRGAGVKEPAGCGNVGSSFTNRGSWNRGAGLHPGTWGLRRWMIGCSTIAFTPTPMWQVLLLGSHAWAGVIPGRSQRPLSGRSRREDHRRGTASLAPSPATGTDG